MEAKLCLSTEWRPTKHPAKQSPHHSGRFDELFRRLEADLICALRYAQWEVLLGGLFAKHIQSNSLLHTLNGLA